MHTFDVEQEVIVDDEDEEPGESSPSFIAAASATAPSSLSARFTEG
jgi:hypothetical protein